MTVSDERNTLLAANKTTRPVAHGARHTSPILNIRKPPKKNLGQRGYFFSYHSAFVAVNFCHFSGRSSSAKIAVTGHTGTQAPQSIHSTGWIYSMVSLA